MAHSKRASASISNSVHAYWGRDKTETVQEMACYPTSVGSPESVSASPTTTSSSKQNRGRAERRRDISNRNFMVTQSSATNITNDLPKNTARVMAINNGITARPSRCTLATTTSTTLSLDADDCCPFCFQSDHCRTMCPILLAYIHNTWVRERPKR